MTTNEFNDVNETNESFVIDNDEKADWAVRKITEAKEEHDRLMGLAVLEQERINNRIAEINRAYENDTGWLKTMLQRYFETVPHRTTKTQEKYTLFSGSLVKKLGGIEYKRDDSSMLGWLNNNKMNEFIKVKEEVNWKDLKTHTMVAEDGSVIYADTGEVIDGVIAYPKEDTFDVVV